MKLILRRIHEMDNCTIGRLSTDLDDEKYFTLEPVVRDHKIAGVTSIPPGSYKVVLEMSPRFGQVRPRLLRVPNFDGVLIHEGNTHLNTEGCILIGETWSGGDFIGYSRDALASLMAKLEKATDEIRILIV